MTAIIENPEILIPTIRKQHNNYSEKDGKTRLTIGLIIQKCKSAKLN
jgi:hypothetical protein